MKWCTERLFVALLWCYPPPFRRRFGSEILQVVRTVTTHPTRGPARALLLDLVRHLPREWRSHVRASPRPTGSHTFDGEIMRTLVQDVRFALRLLGRSPGFTAAAVTTLALGIGANTAILTLADATLLRPLQVQDPHELFAWSWSSSYPDYREYATRTDIFEGVLAVGGATRMNLSIDGRGELTPGVFVSGNAFEVLGVKAAAGRTLLPADDVPGGAVVAVISHAFWRSRFGADPSVVGRTYRINGRPFTIVGVAEEGFRGVSLLSNPAVFLPAAVSSQVRTGFLSRIDPTKTRGFVWLTVIGRLRPDVEVSHAAAAMDAMYTRLQSPPPGADPRTERLRLEPMPTRALGGGAADVRRFVTLLIAVVGVTLLIGCANLANLLLARSAARRRELGVRLALGATRGRVLRQMLVESVLLATLGGAAGIGIAALAMDLLATYRLPGDLDLGNVPLGINRVALAATFGLSLLTGLLFGAWPAWRASRTDVLATLRGTVRGATDRSPMRSTLLAAQVALSLALLAGSMLFARSLMAAVAKEPGFDPRGVVTVSVNLGLARYDADRAAAFYAAALERIQAMPQVTSASWGTLIPTRGLFMGQTAVEGHGDPATNTFTVYGAHAGPEYFEAVGTRILSGRAFAAADRAGTPLVGIVNEAMARKYWAGRDPIGGRFQFFGEHWVTVVGVAENTVVRALGEDPPPQIYLAFDQWLTGREGIATDAAHLFVRTSAPPSAMLPLLRDQLRALDPELPLYDLERFDDRVAALVLPQRMGVALFTLFSAIAVALAAVGIYGVATYVSGLRRREIAVRVALGATRGAIRRLILAQAIPPVVAGVLAGIGLGLYAGQLAAAFLVDVSPTDPVTFGTAPLVLALIALSASYLPARRAARVEPVAALRDE